MEEEKLASEITECEDCPLYKNDCPGGWTSGAGGTPIEPPCCSWNGDEIIYAGMYDYDPRDYSVQELEWERIDRENKEAKERQRKEDLEQQIRKVSRYGNVKTEYAGELTNKWLCPRCHNWFRASCGRVYHIKDIEVAYCPICHEKLAHCYELD